MHSKRSSRPAAKKLLDEFGHWLVARQGLSEATRVAYQCAAKRLIAALGAAPSCYRAAAVSSYIVDEAKGLGRSGVRSVVTGSRSFLRFLVASDRCRPLLPDAVPRVARWRLASLPRYLPAADVERLVASCPTDKPVGLRDRAVLLLLSRLGLRSGDVRALGLRDIDFARGTLRLTGKSRVEGLLPLPQDVGDAVLLYLARARPPSEDHHLFLNQRRTGFGTTTVPRIVRQAAHRAGLGVRCGAHRLRHSAAFRMLHEGASLEAIGAILRHQSLESTAIYAKVDLQTLRLIAQPWPGVAS